MIKPQKPHEKLRIAFVCDPIGSSKAGVVVSTLRFARILKERGHHVIFIGAKAHEHKGNSHYDNIKIYLYRSLPVPKSGGWYLAFPTVSELKKVFAQERIDIVHIVLPMSGGVVAAKAARALGIKVVAHSHSQPENLFMETPKFIQPTLFNIWNSYLTWLYAKAQYLIYPSELARNLLDKLSKKGQPFRVISNGINTNEYRPIPHESFYGKFNIPKTKVKILYLGRLYPEKSLDTLIKAVPLVLEKNRNIHVMIVGAGHLREKLEKLTHTLGVNKEISFLGLVSEEDKVLAYNACDIFVLPSLAELEGMVILEAMACGKPIVVADAPMSASRYFVRENGLLFKPESPVSLAEQVLKLVENEDLRKKMSEASLIASKQYDIHKSVDLLEEVYYSTLNKK